MIVRPPWDDAGDADALTPGPAPDPRDAQVAALQEELAAALHQLAYQRPAVEFAEAYLDLESDGDWRAEEHHRRFRGYQNALDSLREAWGRSEVRDDDAD